MTTPRAGIAPLQIYTTHCTRTDSVTNTVGFGARASSSSDADALKAGDYPAYELPLDLWAKLPTRAEAPRRLARVRAPGGLLAVHSCFLEKDTMGRDRSFFTHGILLKSIDPTELLRSWASPSWMTDYPAGESKQIAAPTALPTGRSISDDAVTAFLSDAELPQGVPLSVSICPDRFAADSRTRHELLARFLKALDVVLNDVGPRKRLYVHAEPGLLAFLLYAALRILPRVRQSDVTFSTYEPAHRGLKDFQRALVVGTYFGHPAKSLDPELASRGYLFDAVQQSRSSEELRAPLHPVFRTLCGIAAEGRWQTLDSLAELNKSTGSNLDRLQAMVASAEALERVNADPPTPSMNDLMLLNREKAGQATLHQRRKELLPFIAEYTLSDAAFGKEFSPWFLDSDRCDVLIAQAFNALEQGNYSRWQLGWNAAPVQNQLAQERLANKLEANSPALLTYPKPMRAILRKAIAERPGTPSKLLLPLFAARDVQELRELISDPNSSAAVQGLIAWIACKRRGKTADGDDMATIAMQSLHSASGQVLSEFLKHAFANIERQPETAKEFLDPLISPRDARTAPAFDRLLSHGRASLNPMNWATIIERYGLFAENSLLNWLLVQDRLALLLRGLAAHSSKDSAWLHFSKKLELLPLIQGDATTLGILGQLDRARQSLHQDGVPAQSVVPVPMQHRIAAAQIVYQAIKGDLSPEKASELPKAFRVFQQQPQDALLLMLQHRFGQVHPEVHAEQFAPFQKMFDACFPPAEFFAGVQNRVQVWIWLSGVCHPAHRMAFELDLFIRTIPREFWAKMLADPTIPLDPHTRQQLQRNELSFAEELEPMTPEPPSSFIMNHATEDSDENSDEEPTPRRSKRKKRHHKRSSPLPWILGLGTAVIIVITLAVIAWTKLK